MLSQFSDQWLLFTLVFTRVGGMMIVAPTFAMSSLPAHVRVVFAIMMAIAVVPFTSMDDHVVVTNLAQLAVFAAREAVLGISIGLAIRILISGFLLSGSLVSRTSGLRLAEVASEDGQTSTSVLSRFMELTTLATFFLIGGHRQVVRTLLDSFQWSPPGSEFAWSGIVHALSDITAQSFIAAIRLAAPVVVALLLTIIVVGLISRTLPQLNSLAVGFSLQSIVMLVALAVSLGAVSSILEEHSEETLATIRRAFEHDDEQAALAK